MLAEKEIELEVTERAMSAIALEGYDPTYGARPLKRVIQQRLQNPLAVELLKQESAAGTRVRIDYVDGEFSFDHVAAAFGVR
jgi:ATP-dependent Clp protease ATP-binding subunit ClpB